MVATRPAVCVSVATAALSTFIYISLGAFAYIPFGAVVGIAFGTIVTARSVIALRTTIFGVVIVIIVACGFDICAFVRALLLVR